MAANSEFVVQARACGFLFHGERLLVQRKISDDVWALPGGRVEPMETAAEAVKREFFEELAIECSVIRLLWVIENRFLHKDKKYFEVGFYFLLSAELHQLEIISSGQPEFEEGLEFQWVTDKDVAGLQFRPNILAERLFDIPMHLEHLTV